jgi:hypothetical protein
MSCAEIASAYSNSTLTKVVNVYQTQFIDFKASGLGDYLRGCISMLQLLKTLKRHTGSDVAFDMDLRNHPMSKFLTCDESLERPANYATLGNFHVDSLIVEHDENDIAYQHIVREVVRYFNKIQQPTFFTHCCKENIYTDVLETEKALIRSKLQPSAELESYIASSLTQLGVTGAYSVLHVRMDDAVCFPHAVGSSQATLNDQLMTDLVVAVRAKVDADKTYVLISTNTAVKEALTGANIRSLPTAVCHIGQNQTPTDEQLRDTLLDFFLMSRASEITGFSTYKRTGFSLECARIYNVPYTFTWVEDKEESERRTKMEAEFRTRMGISI